MPEITFMGHVLTPTGVAPDPKKVSAIQDMPVPTDIPAVRRLCGTIQYLERFIPNLSENLEPLYALTRQSNEWNWNTLQSASRLLKTLKASSQKMPN